MAQLKIPRALLESLRDLPGFEEASFEQVHEEGGQVTSIRINPAKLKEQGDDPALQFVKNHGLLSNADPIPWCATGFYLGERPSFTFDPLFHAGAYYVQEASSMFLEQAIRQTTDLSQPLRVLDLCAAPGGKSTHIQSLINSESLLVSNEVIKSRAAVLEENITKWGAANVVVTNNDPAHFARLQHYFDVVVIDAPCSGSGLFRRDPDAITEWSLDKVQLCHQRQQRIIADMWPALKPGGILIYSTCSYSKEEDEDIADWIADTFGARGISLQIEEAWRIVATVSGRHQVPGYRFYPDKLKGEGLFITVLEKAGNEPAAAIPATGKHRKSTVEKLTRAEEATLEEWLSRPHQLSFLRHQDAVVAVPSVLWGELPLLQSSLYIKKAGVTLGRLGGGALIPDHQFALSGIGSGRIVSIALNNNQAIQYLRREEVVINSLHRGWALVQYEGYSLGWVKLLANRVNNYYPKEWRILKWR